MSKIDNELKLVSWLIDASMAGHAGFSFDEKMESIRGQIRIRSSNIFRFVPRKKSPDPYKLPYFIGIPAKLAGIFEGIEWKEVLIYEDVMMLTTSVALNEVGSPRVNMELGVPIDMSILAALQKGHDKIRKNIDKCADDPEIRAKKLNLDFCLYEEDKMDDTRILVSSMRPVSSVLFKFTYNQCFTKGDMAKLSHARGNMDA